MPLTDSCNTILKLLKEKPVEHAELIAKKDINHLPEALTMLQNEGYVRRSWSVPGDIPTFDKYVITGSGKTLIDNGGYAVRADHLTDNGKIGVAIELAISNRRIAKTALLISVISTLLAIVAIAMIISKT